MDTYIFVNLELHVYNLLHGSTINEEVSGAWINEWVSLDENRRKAFGMFTKYLNKIEECLKRRLDRGIQN